MNVSTGLHVVATTEVEYGLYRVRVAAWARKLPADVTADDVAEYESACDEERA